MSKKVIKRKITGLVGKRIKTAIIMGYEELDDEPTLILTMDDGTQFNVAAWFGGYTGNSEDEYPVFISVTRHHRKPSDTPIQ